jgi:hypothetical protein
MGALANSRNTIERAGQVVEGVPVAAAVKIFVGALTAIDASGNALPAADTAGLKVLGRCEGMPGPGITGLDGDNSSGLAGAITVNIKRGVFKFDNSAGNALTAAQLGKVCYVEDDHTVNKDGGTNKVKAGRVIGLDDSGTSVWVDTRSGGFALASTFTPTQTSNATIAGLPSTAVNPTKADFDRLLAEAGKLQADFYSLLALLT